jgi:hypothetical protein
MEIIGLLILTLLFAFGSLISIIYLKEWEKNCNAEYLKEHYMENLFLGWISLMGTVMCIPATLCGIIMIIISIFFLN